MTAIVGIAWWLLTKIIYVQHLFPNANKQKPRPITGVRLTKMNTCDVNILTRQNSTRLDSASVYAHPHATFVSKPNSLCRVYASLIGLDSTLLVGTHLK
jgi:hypothetical protein